MEKFHRAAVQTGAPIMAHSRPASSTGPRQVEIFLGDDATFTTVFEENPRRWLQPE